MLTYTSLHHLSWLMLSCMRIMHLEEYGSRKWRERENRDQIEGERERGC